MSQMESALLMSKILIFHIYKKNVKRESSPKCDDEDARVFFFKKYKIKYLQVVRRV